MSPWIAQTISCSLQEMGRVTNKVQVTVSKRISHLVRFILDVALKIEWIMNDSICSANFGVGLRLLYIHQQSPVPQIPDCAKITKPYQLSCVLSVHKATFNRTLQWLSWAVCLPVSFSWFRYLASRSCERYSLHILHCLGWVLLGMQRNSQSFLPTVCPYMQPSTSTTSTSESTNATLLPADDPPRLFTSFIHDFDKLWLWISGANMSPLNTFHDALQAFDFWDATQKVSENFVCSYCY